MQKFSDHFKVPEQFVKLGDKIVAIPMISKEQDVYKRQKKGLGTPATRAGIIEKLVKSGFAERKGKSIIPTKDGCNLVCVLSLIHI